MYLIRKNLTQNISEKSNENIYESHYYLNIDWNIFIIFKGKVVWHLCTLTNTDPNKSLHR